MEYYKFQDKTSAANFCIKVNKGEGLYVDPNRITTGYTQPIEIDREYYVIADAVTAKYTDKTPIELDKDDTAQPIWNGYKLMKMVDYFDGNITVYLRKDRLTTDINVNYNKELTQAEILAKVANKLGIV
jgi:hypothetical protein